jgi:hypothetical protein
MFIVLVIVISLFFIGIVLTVVFAIIKCRNSATQSKYSKGSSDSTPSNNNNSKPSASKIAPPAAVDSTSKLSPGGPKSTLGKNPLSTSVGGKSGIKTVLEPEPRKMQAERPLLLQDLSQSRLLAKFKQAQNENSPAKNDNVQALGNTNRETPTNPLNNNILNINETPKSTATVDSKRLNINQLTPQLSTRSKGSFVIRKAADSPNSHKFAAPALDDGGVYGAETGAGIYGADIPVVNSSNSAVSSTKASNSSQLTSKKNSITSLTMNRPASYNTENDIKVNESVNQQNLSSRRISMSNNNNNDNNRSDDGIGEDAEKQSLLKNQDLNSNLTTKNMPLNDHKYSQNLDNTIVSFSENLVTHQTYNPNSNIASLNNNNNNNNAIRKAQFNPLHVILKDKNKYHTTEYI